MVEERILTFEERRERKDSFERGARWLDRTVEKIILAYPLFAEYEMLGNQQRANGYPAPLPDVLAAIYKEFPFLNPTVFTQATLSTAPSTGLYNPAQLSTSGISTVNSGGSSSVGTPGQINAGTWNFVQNLPLTLGMNLGVQDASTTNNFTYYKTENVNTAKLSISAEQNFSLGASLDMAVNGQYDMPQMNWSPLTTNSETQSFDISALINAMPNQAITLSFYWHYHVNAINVDIVSSTNCQVTAASLTVS